MQTMTGNQIRRQYKKDLDLVKAIDDTLRMLEWADENTLVTIKKATGWSGNMRTSSYQIPLGTLIDTVALICQISDKERVRKCIYKGKFNGMYSVGVLRGRGGRNHGYVVTHNERKVTVDDLLELLK